MGTNIYKAMIRLTTVIQIGLLRHSSKKKKRVVLIGRTGQGLKAAPLGLLLCLILFAHGSDSKAQNVPTLDRLQRVAEMIRKGQLATAEAELNVVLKRTPREANALNLLGVVRAQQHRAREAEQLFLRAIEVNKSLLGAYLNIGQLYLDLAKPDRALWAFTEAGKLQPESTSINFNLASLYEEKKEYERALEYLNKIPAAEVDSDVLFLLIKSHLALNHTEEAKALSAPLKESNKVPPDMAAALGAIFAQHGLFNEAIEILEAARKQNPDSFGVLYNLGVSYFQKGEWHQAGDFYAAALALRPNDVATLRALARIAREQGETEKSLSYLVRARKLTPDSPTLLYEFGWTALQQKLFFDALQALSRLYEIQPNEPSYLYAFAVARLLNGESEVALPIINRYLELKPQDSRGYYMLGVALYTLQQLPQARAALTNSLRLAVHPDTQYYLALVAYSEGDLAQALALSQDALKADADFSAAYTLLGTIYVKQGDFSAARAQLESAIELDPTDLKAHYQLGVVYSRLDKKALAQQMFAKANALRKEEREQDVAGLRLIEPPP
jgi:tetratricopeptide (TPR) repeat protein